MALPKIYQSSRDARLAGAENGMTDEPVTSQPPEVEANEDPKTEQGETQEQENAEAPQDPEGMQGQDGQPATKQEQDQYDELVTSAMAMMYHDTSTIKALIDHIKSIAKGKDISVGIGQQAALIMLSLVRGLKQKGLQADPDVVFNAGLEVVSDLTEACTRVNLVPSEAFDKVVQDATYEATRYFGEQEQAAGEITPEMKAKAQQFMQADINKHAPPGSIANAQSQPQQPPQQMPPQQPPQPQGAM